MQTAINFDGATFDQERDGNRLSVQLNAVRDYALKRDWVTLSEMEAALGYTSASISARLRDLRKAKFGAYTVEREYVYNGVWKYRVTK